MRSGAAAASSDCGKSLPSPGSGAFFWVRADGEIPFRFAEDAAMDCVAFHSTHDTHVLRAPATCLSACHAWQALAWPLLLVSLDVALSHSSACQPATHNRVGRRFIATHPSFSNF